MSQDAPVRRPVRTIICSALCRIRKRAKLQPQITDGLSIGIGPVSFPDYLDRQQIVIRTGPNEISFSEFDRWAEPLKNNFMRVFKEDLVERLRTDNIFVYPWPPGAVFEFQVSAEVTRFDAHPGDSAKLDVQWMILRNHDREVILSRKSSYTVEPRQIGL